MNISLCKLFDLLLYSSHWLFGFNLQSVAFCSFMTFTLCQTVAAFVAGSEAMMGDSAAMFVDALTYLFNLVAERKKNRFDEEQCDDVVGRDPVIACRIRQRTKRKMTLHLELVPPLVSVTSLMIVMAFVLRKAIRVLILDIHRDKSKQGDPNVNLMLTFSSVNLGLDFVNVFCFARAKHLMGYDTHIEETKISYEYVETTDKGLDGNRIHGAPQVERDRQRSNGAHENGDNVTYTIQEQSNGLPSRSVDEKQTDEQEEKEGANLNMCSAYTVSLVLPLCCCLLSSSHFFFCCFTKHVFADTLRSIAVIIAAVVAKVVDEVTPEEADATAAVVVSVLILLSLIPLFQGMIQTSSELRAIRAEESSESKFSEESNQTSELV